MEQGKIVKVVAGFYDVRSNNDRKIYRVRGGGKLRLLDIIPIVGDYVEFEKNELKDISKNSEEIVLETYDKIENLVINYSKNKNLELNSERNKEIER